MNWIHCHEFNGMVWDDIESAEREVVGFCKNL